MPNRNESKFLQNILTKDDAQIKEELKESQIPVNQANKLMMLMVKNKKKMIKIRV